MYSTFLQVIKIAKRMTKFLYAHTIIHDYMVSITKKEILRPGTTRFATNFILLKSLSDVRDGLGQMFTSAQWHSNRKFAKYRSSRQCADTRRQALDDGYWERVDVVVKVNPSYGFHFFYFLISFYGCFFLVKSCRLSLYQLS